MKGGCDFIGLLTLWVRVGSKKKLKISWYFNNFILKIEFFVMKR